MADIPLFLKGRFIVFLFIIFLASCNRERHSSSDEMPPLYQAPKTIALNTVEGHLINPLTGDSIQAIINSFGDTVKTGVPIPATGKTIHPDSVAPLYTYPAGKPEKVPTREKVYPVPNSLAVTSVNKDSLRTFTPGIDTSSFVLVNSIGDTLPTGIRIPVQGKIVSCIQAVPVKALPPRMNDNAILNLKYLDTDEWMNSANISAILEARDGNIWFGSIGGGIVKYTGESFTNYSEKEGLSNNLISSILEDSKGNIWFGHFGGGVGMYDGDSFTRFSEMEGLSDNDVSTIREDSCGNLWFGTFEGGVSMYNGKTFTHFTPKEGLSDNSVLSILEDSRNNLWFATGSGVDMYTGETFTNLIDFTNDGGGVYTTPSCMLEDGQHNIWIGTSLGGVLRYDGESFTQISTKEGLSSNYVTCMVEDRYGNIWIGTMGEGVNKYNGKTITHITEKEGLSNNNIQSIFEDSHGNLWFGTREGGISIYNSESFAHFTQKDGLSGNTVSSIVEDNRGNYWIGTHGNGVNMYDGESFTHFSSKEGLYSDAVVSVLEDSQGNLWFGTDGGGVTMYNGETFTLMLEFMGLSSNYVYAMAEDKHGNFWFGTYSGGLSMYDGTSFTHFTEKEGLSNNSVWSILEDSRGNIWFGTKGGGVSRYNGETFIHFTEREGLSNNNVWSILEDRRGNLWFGTDAGVSIYNGETFTYFTEKEGLSHNTIHSIVEDRSNNIWLGTQDGLNHLVFDSAMVPGVKYSPYVSRTIEDTDSILFENTLVHTYGLKDGLKSEFFWKNSVLSDKENRIWWGTSRGLTLLDMSKYGITVEPPDIQLDHLEINGHFLDYRHVNDRDGMDMEFNAVAKFHNYPIDLELPFKQNHLTFHYSAMDLSAQHKIKYSFRMEGLQDTWSVPSETAIADYRQLPYGTYTFIVRAIGDAQKWSKPFEYTFTIKPPWWHTWFARTGYAFLVFLIVLSIVRWRTAKLKQRQKELEAEVRDATAEILEQKEEVEIQRDQLEKHRDLVVSQKNEILDSIAYAKRIQTAMLPPEIYFTELLNESFILFKPKDIVSGDFYWIKQVNQYIVLLAADCTGHGVPGALMSMLGISYLNEIVQRREITQANQILNELRKQIKFSLRQHGKPDEAKEGIDLALCVLDLRNMKMQYAGANNPLYLIKEVDDVPELEEIKADRMPIGYYQGKDKSFTNHDIQLKMGVTFYIFSDGFIDQKGGTDSKKFMSKKFKNLLLDIHDRPMHDQKNILDKTLSDWMGNNSQMDDVLVIGVRV